MHSPQGEHNPLVDCCIILIEYRAVRYENVKNKKAAAKNGCLFCRGTPTRTEDPLLPKQIR